MSLNKPVRDWPASRIWVVGASSGIGLALAEALAARGARVAVSARRAAPLQAFADSHGERALALPLDMTENVDWDGAWADIKQAWGGIDWVVFCAADYTPVRAWELDRDRAAQLINVNLTGTLRGVATVLPDMLAAGAGGVGLVAVGRRLYGPAEVAGLWPDQGRVDQLCRVLVSGCETERAGCLHHQPWIRGDTADGTERLRDAGTDDAGSGRAGNYSRFGAR